MTDDVTLKPEEYRRNAKECWERVEQAHDLETKAVFELTAEAWQKLATQAEKVNESHAP